VFLSLPPSQPPYLSVFPLYRRGRLIVKSIGTKQSMAQFPLRAPQLDLSALAHSESASHNQSGGLGRGGRQAAEEEALNLCNSQLLKVSCLGGDEKTPRSIALTSGENRVLRMPDSGLMFKQQRNLQEMLADIHQDPDGFQDFINDIRSDMRLCSDAVPSPFDTRCGCLADYTIKRSVGKGRFSVVHAAHRKRDMLAVAVKRIYLSAAAGEKVSQSKCLKEVGLLRSLKHPNIIRYLDSFLEKDELCIVLEWAGGGDLKGLLQSHRKRNVRLSETTLWGYFSQCCEAVRHMHEQRIMHRDIKPSNVFIMDDGKLKLGDLGLGRYLDLHSIFAFSQVGTPYYMSPEVLRGEGHHFSSDVWSLGCLLYELAQLRSPFHAKGLTMDKLFLKIIRGEYAPVDPACFTARVQEVIDTMLQVNPKERPTIVWVANAALLARSSTGAVDDPQSTPRLPELLKNAPARAALDPAVSQPRQISIPAQPHLLNHTPLRGEAKLNPVRIPASDRAQLIHPSSSPLDVPVSEGGIKTAVEAWGSRSPPISSREDRRPTQTPTKEEKYPTSHSSSMSQSQDTGSPKLFQELYDEEEMHLMNEILHDDGTGTSKETSAAHPVEEQPQPLRVENADAVVEEGNVAGLLPLTPEWSGVLACSDDPPRSQLGKKHHDHRRHSPFGTSDGQPSSERRRNSLPGISSPSPSGGVRALVAGIVHRSTRRKSKQGAASKGGEEFAMPEVNTT